MRRRSVAPTADHGGRDTAPAPARRLACTLIAAFAARHRLFPSSAAAVSWLRLARPGRAFAVEYACLQQLEVPAAPVQAHVALRGRVFPVALRGRVEYACLQQLEVPARRAFARPRV